jgi:hypothetical protein
MTAKEKLLRRMEHNPASDWSIDDLRTIADAEGIGSRQNGTSHVIFTFAGLPSLTVPAHRPIRKIYVARFVAFVRNVRSLRATP